jgi:hypothetical protein
MRGTYSAKSVVPEFRRAELDNNTGTVEISSRRRRTVPRQHRRAVAEFRDTPVSYEQKLAERLAWQRKTAGPHRSA